MRVRPMVIACDVHSCACEAPPADHERERQLAREILDMQHEVEGGHDTLGLV